ncbi:MAG: carbamoyl-phosphate synthase (glutamine-hydrolyzing) small subunit, partial [Tannerella sp.]|nr:carbamoyl-phosphate synthase (glutamine-hydrolyzing) small subunit [Tannerella sp.]
MNLTKATLILDDGSKYEGFSFGAEKSVTGEVVFNTAMSGYPESLTDPSYAGQLMVLAYPLVGNYGVPARTLRADGLSVFMESDRIHAEAIIVSDYS